MGLANRDGGRLHGTQGEAMPSFMRPPEERSTVSILTMVLTLFFVLELLVSYLSGPHNTALQVSE
jgi:hypothetical protein